MEERLERQWQERLERHLQPVQALLETQGKQLEAHGQQLEQQRRQLAEAAATSLEQAQTIEGLRAKVESQQGELQRLRPSPPQGAAPSRLATVADLEPMRGALDASQQHLGAELEALASRVAVAEGQLGGLSAITTSLDSASSLSMQAATGCDTLKGQVTQLASDLGETNNRVSSLAGTLGTQEQREAAHTIIVTIPAEHASDVAGANSLAKAAAVVAAGADGTGLISMAQVVKSPPPPRAPRALSLIHI